MASRITYAGPAEPVRVQRQAWAILMRYADGKSAYLAGTADHPCRTRLFETRREAREYIEKRYGYVRKRPDLKAEPHGWRMPTPIRVSVKIDVDFVVGG